MKLFSDFYLFGSRLATHIIFWLVYYLCFSLIWAKPDQSLFASFYLEFVLLPVRILAVYAMIYYLIPKFLVEKAYKKFWLGYFLLLACVGLLQRLSGYFFYELLILKSQGAFFDPGAIVRSILLVNTTVVFVAAAKLFQLYIKLKDKVNADSNIEVTSERRTHRLKADDILYIEGMGNYVTYFLNDGRKLVVYKSIKKTIGDLPGQFVRLQRSYIINKNHIRSYSQENVQIGDKEIPRGKDITDQMLAV